MANAYLNLAKTTTTATLLRRVLAECRLGSASSQYQFLGSDSTSAEKTLADVLNDGIRDVLNRFPLFGISTDDLTVTAGDREVDLPATLRNCDIISVRWASTEDDGYANAPLKEYSEQQVDGMPAEWRDDDYTVSYPYGYAVAKRNRGSDTATILLFPAPSETRELTIEFRATSTEITRYDLTETDAIGSAVLSGGAVASVSISTAGAGYASAPTVSFSGGGGTGAAGTAVISSTGTVTSITITSGGSGYTTAPTVSFSGGRTIVPVPDAAHELMDLACAWRLAKRLGGSSAVEWKELKSQFLEECAVWTGNLSRSQWGNSFQEGFRLSDTECGISFD